MGLREFFLWQLEHEVASSRALFERVPEGRSNWKPHPTGMELGHLATLVASMPGWVALMVNRRVLNLEQTNDITRTTPVNTRAELRHLLATGLEKSRKALEDATEDHLVCIVRFRKDGHVVSEGPRYAMIADTVIAQQAHHRGQLSVYLDLLEAEASTNYTSPANRYLCNVKESGSPNKLLFVESLKLKRNLIFFSGSESSDEVSSSWIRNDYP